MNKKELIRFVDEIKEQWELGRIYSPIHLPGGNEEQLIEYFNNVREGDWVFSTWRSMYHYLLKTEDTNFLRNKILNEYRSMHIIDLPRRFVSSSIVSGICSQAVGVAKAIKIKNGEEHVHCFIGDGACDSGSFWESLRYAEGWDLPITFIIEDNNRSVCTPVRERWGERDRWLEGLWGNRFVHYYSYVPTYPHVGTNKFVRFM